MNKKIKSVITFSISYIISYFIVGYIKGTVFVKIHWIEGATAWDKFREYYIRTLKYNLLPALILAIIITIVVILLSNKENK